MKPQEYIRYQTEMISLNTLNDPAKSIGGFNLFSKAQRSLSCLPKFTHPARDKASIQIQVCLTRVQLLRISLYTVVQHISYIFFNKMPLAFH